MVESVEDPNLQVTLHEARKMDAGAEVGAQVERDITPPNFGRIGAQTAKQVILQRIREAERDHVYNEFIDREGDIITGVVRRIDPRGIVLETGAQGKAEALLPPPEQVQSERHRMGQRIRVYLLEVNRAAKGPMLIVSRAHRNFVRRLMELEIPEIYNGVVEVKAIAREAGSRSKVAVHSRQSGLDPVGACVGQRGMRIQNIVNELGGERIDIIPWNEDQDRFVANALSPARVIEVTVDETHQDGHGDRPRGAALPGHRQGGAERPPGGEADRVAGGHQERRRAAGDGAVGRPAGDAGRRAGGGGGARRTASPRPTWTGRTDPHAGPKGPVSRRPAGRAGPGLGGVS